MMFAAGALCRPGRTALGAVYLAALGRLSRLASEVGCVLQQDNATSSMTLQLIAAGSLNAASVRLRETFPVPPLTSRRAIRIPDGGWRRGGGTYVCGVATVQQFNTE